MRLLLVVAVAFVIVPTVGCCHTPKARTVAEEQSGYTYIPLDPFPAKAEPVACPEPMTSHVRLVTIPEALTDNCVRVSTAEIDQNGNLSYGVGSVTEEGKRYRVTTDFANTTTVQFPVWIKKTVRRWDYEKDKPVGEPVVVDPSVVAEKEYAIGSATYDVRSQDPKDADFRPFNIPLYVGLGLRVTAQVNSLKGSADISGLGALGMQAEAKSVTGFMVLQTLGINGKAVTGAIPIHSELNRTTVQSAIVAISSVKALLYGPDVYVQPRIIGMYLPLPADQRLVNKIISELAGATVKWPRPCVPVDAGAGPAFIPSL